MRRNGLAATRQAERAGEAIGSGSVVRAVPPGPCPSRTKKPRPASRCLGIEEVGRGCVYNNREYSRKSGFFAIAVEKFFDFRADWHEDDRARPLVRQYQAALDSVLQSHGQLQ